MTKINKFETETNAKKAVVVAHLEKAQGIRAARGELYLKPQRGDRYDDPAEEGMRAERTDNALAQGIRAARGELYLKPQRGDRYDDPAEEGNRAGRINAFNPAEEGGAALALAHALRAKHTDRRLRYITNRVKAQRVELLELEAEQRRLEAAVAARS